MKSKSRLLISAVLGIFLLGGAYPGSAQESNKEGPFFYNDNGKRDPLWPLVSSSGTIINYDTDFLITDLTLEGIMLGEGGNNLAIINGRIVKTNDQIGNYSVSMIDAESVILVKDQQKFELRLKKEE